MVKRTIMFLVILAVVFVSSVTPVYGEPDSPSVPNPEIVLDAIPDRNPGDRVNISGTTTLGEITIRVISPKEIVLYVNTTKDLNFNMSFVLPADAQLGKYTVVAGTGQKTSRVMFTVSGEANIVSIDKVTVTTNAGTAPKLPSQVTVTYSDDSTAQLPVAWDAIEPAQYASAGTFTVEGTVEGTSIKTIAEVTVTAVPSPVIVGIDKVTVTTNAGTAPKLPSKVTVRYSDDSTAQLPVAWDAIEPAQYASAGTFTVEGTVEGTSIKAIAEVTVTALPSPVIVGIDKVTVTTNAGTAPKLPSQVTVTYSDDSTAQLPVVWDAIESARYASAGMFTVEGTVEGTDIKATATITVNKRRESDDDDDDDDSSGGGSSSGSGSGGKTPTPTPVKPDQPKTEAGNINFEGLVPNAQGILDMIVDETIFRKALDGITVDKDGIKTVKVNVTAVSDANEYRLTLPVALLSSETADIRVNLVTDIIAAELPSDMLKNSEIQGETITVSICIANTEGLDEELVKAIGNRPVISLNIYAGDKRIPWNNNNTHVGVSIKYQPDNPVEASNYEFITVWYIDGEGNAVPVTNAKYNTETGEMVFTTTHFSRFAVVYAPKSFTDLASHSWAKHEIEVLASKGIINGISVKLYDPYSNITRADFLKLLITTLDLSAEVTDNFTDVSDADYYYQTVGIAKALGIVNGVGDGRFEPKTAITRQDMMVMVNRALDVAQMQLEDITGSALLSFDDAVEIADYARISVETLIKSGVIKGSNNLINPRGNTSRAEAAVVLYRLYNK